MHVRDDPVHHAFEGAFPVADAWMAACSLLDVSFNLNEGNYAIASAAIRLDVAISAAGNA